MANRLIAALLSLAVIGGCSNNADTNEPQVERSRPSEGQRHPGGVSSDELKNMAPPTAPGGAGK